MTRHVGTLDRPQSRRVRHGEWHPKAPSTPHRYVERQSSSSDWFSGVVWDEEVHSTPTVRMVRLASDVNGSGSRARARFEELAATCKRETMFESSPTRILLHPAYQQIIGMGPPAVPLLIRALREDPYHWFWALKSITGEDPAGEAQSASEARDAWTSWAQERGIL